MTKEQQSFLEALEREREQRNRVVVINQTRVMIADDSSNDQKEHKKNSLKSQLWKNNCYCQRRAENKFHNAREPKYWL